MEETEENIARSIAEAKTQRSKKLTVEDLTNVIIVEKEECRRPSNFLGKINSFFAAKSKSTKQDDLFKNSSNYENHMLQSEMPTLEIPDFNSYKNRPLPEIPVSLSTSSSSVRRPEKISTKNKKPQPNTGGSLPRKRISVDLPRLAEPHVEVTKKITKPDNRSRLDTVETQKEKTRTSDSDNDVDGNIIVLLKVLKNNLLHYPYPT